MNDEQTANSRVGTELRGKWRLERLLGVGGMAAVYEATHRIGRKDAIKILHPTVARSKELRERFEQEAHAVNRFSHPGAVEIRDVDATEEGVPFLVMEVLDGQPLSERVGPQAIIGIRELLRFMDELLDVLAAAHAEGIIHRDIKPDNLFILKNGRLKVLDFGIARMREGTSTRQQTLVGTRLGTVPYMPPEQVRGLPIDARADLFAVGAMMFRLIAKRRVHEATSEAEMVAKMTTEPAGPLALAAPDAPAEVCMVVDRSLTFDRERRYPDAATMQKDVRAAREGRQPPFAAQALADWGLPNTAVGPALGAAAASIGELATAAASPSAQQPSLADAATAAASPVATGRIPSLGEMNTAAASPSAKSATGPDQPPDSMAAVGGLAATRQVGPDASLAQPTAVSPGAPPPPSQGAGDGAPQVAIAEAPASVGALGLAPAAMASTTLGVDSSLRPKREDRAVSWALAVAGAVLVCLLLVTVIGYALWPDDSESAGKEAFTETVAGKAADNTDRGSASGDAVPAQPAGDPAATPTPRPGQAASSVDPKAEPKAPAGPTPAATATFTSVKPADVSPTGKSKKHGKGKGKGHKGKKKKKK